ncbi:unnamed protein product [Effrenium voratum]|uniref:CBF1-interacting co-repressor CIR N-terminal domain-containing protein n=1 Tax=Effrenium voratum TaxID=2562239 RepID=A0AA36JFU6_9DINO|nr:unnamed protein product [Effrenium voratum]CAJ1458321.1 unnamed protein product [Effrenium voratum]
MGRHGGINILHQKSWHVWRMDNRLRVERDELQHAAKVQEQQAAERREAFDSKLSKLRSAAGVPEPRAVVKAPVQESRTQGDDYGKYGVTTSNLKQAESHLKTSLQSRSREGSYWGKEGLGSGPHINLFEGAELEVQRQATAHGKLLRYQETNNGLAEKSQKRPLSEFDEMAQEQPWYMKAERPLAVAEAVEEETAGPTKKWRRRNGQLMLKVVPDGKPQVCDLVSSALEDAEGRSPKEKKAKEEKRRSKKEKKAQKERRAAEELQELRRQRQLREETESRRAAALR